MPTFRNSRYSLLPKLAVEDEKGRVRTVYEQRDTTVFPADRPLDTAQVGPRPGSSFNQVARDTLGDHKLWWLVADFNPEVFYPLDLTDGTPLRVPPRASVARFTRFQRRRSAT